MALLFFVCDNRTGNPYGRLISLLKESVPP
jgi:hypothetical protein